MSHTTRSFILMLLYTYYYPTTQLPDVLKAVQTGKDYEEKRRENQDLMNALSTVCYKGQNQKESIRGKIMGFHVLISRKALLRS